MKAEGFISGGRLDINRIVAEYRDRPALVQLGKNRVLYTFEDVARLAAILRGRFRDMGILPGSRVAIHMENSPLHFLVFFFHGPKTSCLHH